MKGGLRKPAGFVPSLLVFAIVACVFTVVLNSLWPSSSSRPGTRKSVQRTCASNQRDFLGSCWCSPGSEGAECRPVTAVKGCACPAAAGDVRCLQWCQWSSDGGITRTGNTTWKQVSNFEFDIWKVSKDSDDRSAEHMEGFNSMTWLPDDLGHVVEIGCGPFTQTKAVLQSTNKPGVASITLVEPNIYRYVSSVAGCSYKHGSLLDKPTNLISGKVEDLFFQDAFDTLIHMNVLEHVSDAFQYLTKAYEALKPGGLLIFHERWHPDPDGSSCILGGYDLHPVRVYQGVLQHFLSLFEPIYNNNNHTSATSRMMQGAGNGCVEHAYYFAGRKRRM